MAESVSQRSRPLAIRVPSDLYAQIEREAVELGVSVSDIAREAQDRPSAEMGARPWLNHVVCFSGIGFEVGTYPTTTLSGAWRIRISAGT